MSSRPTSIRYRGLAWLTLAAALAYLSRNAVSVAESTIRGDLSFSLEQSGWFMGAFFWTYSLLQVPSGWLAERWGTRIALSLFAFAWSVATLGIGVAPGFGLLIVAQLVMGVAQAGIFPASCNSIGSWMPLGQRSLSCGILAAGMQIGAILASGLTGLLIAPWGWRWVFVGFAVPGILWSVGFYLRFRNHPEQDARVNAAELATIRAGRPPAANPGSAFEADPDKASEAELSEGRELLLILRSPVLWWLCGQQVCRGSGYMFFASWFPTFLQETRGVSVANSGYLQGLVLAGTLLGSLFGGTLVDWIWRRTGSLRLSRSGVGATFLAACALLILAAWFVQNAILAVALLSSGSFLAALAGPCAFAATIDIGGSRVPQVFGVMNMTGNLAAASCPVLVGYLFQWTSNWNLVLLLFAAVYLAGAVCWIFVNPQKHIDNA
ncbi:MAG: MFS transporter [Novipirellula sp. JB048]